MQVKLWFGDHNGGFEVLRFLFGFLLENGEKGLWLFFWKGCCVVLGKRVRGYFFDEGKGSSLFELERFDHSEPEGGEVEKLFRGTNESAEGYFEVLVEFELKVSETVLEDLFEVKCKFISD